MDNILRTTERQAFIGGLDAEARHLAARERSEVSGLTVPCACVRIGKAPCNGACCGGLCLGTGCIPFTWPERLALAAYCGSEAARMLVKIDGTTFVIDEYGFSEWLSDLRHHHSYALLRGAVAAAECALPEWEYEAGWIWDGTNLREREHVMLGPAIGHREASCPRRAVEAARLHLEGPTVKNRDWLIDLLVPFQGSLEWLIDPRDNQHGLQARIQAATQITKPEDVRDSIQVELIIWVLGSH